MLNSIIRFFLDQKLVTVLFAALLIAWGISTSPFRWDVPFLPSNPVPVDAIPDIGENQQIVYTDWMGRSPQDVEDQITYPLTASLLGLPGVKSIRSNSMFGFSSIYIIFEDDVEYYWSRTRILEKINALPAGLLPDGVQPQLGPDATALGQVFWYTLEALDQNGNPVPGAWDLHELRAIQDFHIKPALNATPGVSEVASVGGFVKEYQIDLDPDAMRLYGISMMQVMEAVRASNRDAGANTLELNQVEYLVRGLGYIRSIDDIEQSVIASRNNVPVRIADIARVTIGPAPRSERGILDKNGAEVAGGVVVARYGDNPLQVIDDVKERIERLEPGLPVRTMEDGTVAKVTIVPFYDRSSLIHETLGTLSAAIYEQILITVIVILVMIGHLRASIMISSLLPMAVVMAFIFMRYFGVDANIVALSGIAIAIGTLVDLGIILSENVVQHQEKAPPGESMRDTIYKACTEVTPAIITAVATTAVSFLPVFTLEAAEGKLFTPLAWTKTFAIISALIITVTLLPAFSHVLFGWRIRSIRAKECIAWAGVVTGLVLVFWFPWTALFVIALSINSIAGLYYPIHAEKWQSKITTGIIITMVTWLLSENWMPLGVHSGELGNFFFVALLLLIILAFFAYFLRMYPHILAWCMGNRRVFLIVPLLFILTGASIWLGFDRVFGIVARGGDAIGVNIRTSTPWSAMVHTFPGLGKEFMPALDEGAFLYMPTVMAHGGTDVSREYLSKLDRLMATIPEVETVVGKAGRAESALDPAPMSMFENVILYKSEYKTDDSGRRMRFKADNDGQFVRDADGEPIPDLNGVYYRQWRDHIRTPEDIWQEITRVAQLPGITSAPKLQPIETRLVMLQTGMRAPMGIKVFGPDLETIEAFSLDLEHILRQVPAVKPEAVFADRLVGKPYMEIHLDRRAMARYGLTIEEVQNFIEAAIGGMTLSTTVEGRERFSIRVRLARDYREDPESIEAIPLSGMDGMAIPLGQVANIEYRRGPMMIRGEDTFLTGYVLFDRQTGVAEVNAVEAAQRAIEHFIADGSLKVPDGVHYVFSGNYENQIRAERRLQFVVPLCLVLIFLILYFQFRSTSTSLMIFSAIALTFSGGFIMIWLYGQGWFLDFSIFGVNARDMFQISPANLSVAVWVGFIALFGIATDDGVVIGSYLDQIFAEKKPSTVHEIREAAMEAGLRRARPCLMTSVTTLLALLPVLTSSGRGADIMIPMAIPAFGGMIMELTTMFMMPVLYAWREERKLKRTAAGDKP